MLNKIKILPEHITNKIAAGEVVQRPESVVKELIENSIDAGATEIELIIKNAGKSLIQIVDNGSGMNEEDAVNSIKRHATSKINNIEDLEKIMTFGFRGEALSSIASVSRMEIKTRTKDDELGTFVSFEDDNIVSVEKISFNIGTSISVKNLFYNTPARRNFLKSNATELKHIIETFKRISLSNVEISFKLINDDDIIYDFKKSSLIERMQIIFADNINDAVIEVNEPTSFISLSGYISKPTFIKKNRSEQFLFVNKRYVNCRLVNHAVFTAFENILIKGDYPFFVLFLDIEPSHFDINVHPSKLEIKFDDENSIYSFVNAVIRRSLGSYDLVPNLKIGDDDSNFLKLNKDYEKTYEKNNFSDRPTSNLNREERKVFSDDEIDNLFESINREIKSNNSQQINNDIYRNESISSNNQIEVESSLNDNSFIVMLHKKYILAQIRSGLMIIDAHVAHERILYEKALKSFEVNIPFSQHLLFPQTVHVDAGDYALLKEIENYLIKLGFTLKFTNKNNILIEGVPAEIKVGNEIEILFGLLDEYKNNLLKNVLSIKDNLAKSYSCKAALKAGDKLNEKEIRLLVDQLFATSMPYVCPHGRPIVVKISINEFDKRFGRT